MQCSCTRVMSFWLWRITYIYLLHGNLTMSVDAVFWLANPVYGHVFLPWNIPDEDQQHRSQATTTRKVLLKTALSSAAKLQFSDISFTFSTQLVWFWNWHLLVIHYDIYWNGNVFENHETYFWCDLHVLLDPISDELSSMGPAWQILWHISLPATCRGIYIAK